jgi:TolB-like protein
LLLLVVTLSSVVPVLAQNSSADVIMILPFENTSNRPEYNWVGESFADALAELLNKPGLIVVSVTSANLPTNSCICPRQ